MSITVQTFTSKLREYIGTPFHHAGRVKGPNGGVDCGGLISCAAHELGLSVSVPDDYAPGDGIDRFVEILAANCTPESAVTPGVVLLLRSRTMYHHLVYYTEANTIIHAWQTSAFNQVVETSMLPDWWQDILSIWRLNGVDQWPH